MRDEARAGQALLGEREVILRAGLGFGHRSADIERSARDDGEDEGEAMLRGERLVRERRRTGWISLA